MKEELTEKMHSEFSINQETEIKHRVGSAIHYATILNVKKKEKFKQILENFSVTFSDYEKWKKHYEKLGLILNFEYFEL